VDGKPAWWHTLVSPSTQEAEGKGLRIRSQPRIHSDPVSKEKKIFKVDKNILVKMFDAAHQGQAKEIFLPLQ
jgi:hypothetical protein